MEASSSHFLDWLMLDAADNSRDLVILSVPVTALSLVVGCSATTPGIHDTVLVQSHRMEVSTVDLSDFGALICQRFDQTWFILRWTFRRSCRFRFASFFMQSAAPRIDMTFFRETHGVVVSARHHFHPHWQAYQSELSQVDDAV